MQELIIEDAHDIENKRVKLKRYIYLQKDIQTATY